MNQYLLNMLTQSRVAIAKKEVKSLVELSPSNRSTLRHRIKKEFNDILTRFVYLHRIEDSTEKILMINDILRILYTKSNSFSRFYDVFETIKGERNDDFLLMRNYYIEKFGIDFVTFFTKGV